MENIDEILKLFSSEVERVNGKTHKDLSVSKLNLHERRLVQLIEMGMLKELDEKLFHEFLQELQSLHRKLHPLLIKKSMPAIIKDKTIGKTDDAGRTTMMQYLNGIYGDEVRYGSAFFFREKDYVDTNQMILAIIYMGHELGHFHQHDDNEFSIHEDSSKEVPFPSLRNYSTRVQVPYNIFDFYNFLYGEEYEKKARRVYEDAKFSVYWSSAHEVDAREKGNQFAEEVLAVYTNSRFASDRLKKIFALQVRNAQFQSSIENSFNDERVSMYIQNFDAFFNISNNDLLLAESKKYEAKYSFENVYRFAMKEKSFIEKVDLLKRCLVLGYTELGDVVIEGIAKDGEYVSSANVQAEIDEMLYGMLLSENVEHNGLEFELTKKSYSPKSIMLMSDENVIRLVRALIAKGKLNYVTQLLSSGFFFKDKENDNVVADMVLEAARQKLDIETKDPNMAVEEVDFLNLIDFFGGQFGIAELREIYGKLQSVEENASFDAYLKLYGEKQAKADFEGIEVAMQLLLKIQEGSKKFFGADEILELGAAVISDGKKLEDSNDLIFNLYDEFYRRLCDVRDSYNTRMTNREKKLFANMLFETLKIAMPIAMKNRGIKIDDNFLEELKILILTAMSCDTSGDVLDEVIYDYFKNNPSFVSEFFKLKDFHEMELKFLEAQVKLFGESIFDGLDEYDKEKYNFKVNYSGTNRSSSETGKHK